MKIFINFSYLIVFIMFAITTKPLGYLGFTLKIDFYK